MIIGLTGKNAAGKGVAADYLKTKGFAYHSLSDALRDEAAKLGLQPTRDNLIRLGNGIRAKRGPGFLAKKIIEKMKESKNADFVIDSIRSPFEARELMKNKDFILVGIDAPVGLRLERMLKRNRQGDARTLDELKQQELKENLNSDTNQQLDAALAMAQKVIVNDGTLEELHEKIEELLKELK